MLTLGFILFMIGACGITDPDCNLQIVPVVMTFAGLLFLLLGYKRREI